MRFIKTVIFISPQEMKAVMEGAGMDAPGDRGGWHHDSCSDIEFKVHHTEVKVVCLSYRCRKVAVCIFS
jgi:hypothetical protein